MNSWGSYFVVDVATEYKPEITASSLDDQNSLVVVFIGMEDSVKYTQMNALFAYLLGSSLGNSHKIHVIDESLNPKSTVIYRIRPFTASYRGKTLYVVDCPLQGHLPVLKVALPKIDCFFLVLNTTEQFNSFNFIQLSNLKTSLVNNVLKKFKNKSSRQCLRTIFTHQNVAYNTAVERLRKLKWPCEKGFYVEVKNSAFDMPLSDTDSEANAELKWSLLLEGQKRVAEMMFPTEPYDFPPSWLYRLFRWK